MVIQPLRKGPAINIGLLAKNYLYLTVGTVLLVVSFHLFLGPHNLAPGGLIGLALIVEYFTGWSFGWINILLQVPMLILGFFLLGRFNFLMYSMYLMVLYSFLIDSMAGWFPPEGISPDPILNSLYGAVVGGAGGALMLLGQGTFAGTSVASRAINLKTGLPNSTLYLVIDGSVIFAQGMIFGWGTSLYGFLILFVWGVVTDYVMEGPSMVKTAFIITNEPDKVSQSVFETLGVGVTSWTARGMYSKTDTATLFCTVFRTDIDILKQAVNEADSKAFVVIGQGHQTKGGLVKSANRDKANSFIVQPKTQYQPYHPMDTLQPTRL